MKPVGCGRTHLRGHANILKRVLVHVGGFNLGLVMRSLVGVGTPRSLQGHLATVVALVIALWTRVEAAGATTTRYPTIRRPCLRHIIVSSCYLLARQKATFNHGLLVVIRQGSS